MMIGLKVKEKKSHNNKSKPIYYYQIDKGDEDV